MTHSLRAFACLLLALILTVPYGASAAGAPTVEVSAVSKNQVSGTYTKLPANSLIVLADYNSGERVDEFGVYVGKAGNGSFAIDIPTDFNGGVGGLYKFRAFDYDNPSTVYDESTYFSLGGMAENSPDCSLKASTYTVTAGRPVTLTWSSKAAWWGYTTYGFPSDKRVSKKGKITLRPAVAGLAQFTMTFQGSSGSQSSCTAYVNVLGRTPTGSFNNGIATVTTRKPVISGTASNVSTIVVTIEDHELAGGQVWKSRPTTVRNGRWSVAVTPALPYNDYEYGGNLYAYDQGQYIRLAAMNLTVAASE